MAKDYAKKFYSSKTWQQCREAYARSVGYLCEDCRRAGVYTPGEIVHHRVFLTADNINNPSISLNFANLKLVCRECHRAEHRAESGDRYFFNRAGEIIQRGSPYRDFDQNDPKTEG